MADAHWHLVKEDGEYVVYSNNMDKPLRENWRADKLGDAPFQADTEQYHRTKTRYKVDPRYYTGFYKLVFPMPIPPHEKHIYDSQLKEGRKIDPSRLVINGEYVMLNSEPTDLVVESQQTPQEPLVHYTPQEIKQPLVTDHKTTPILTPSVKGIDIKRKLYYKKFEDPKELVKFINKEKIQKDDIQQFGLEIYYWSE